MLPTFHSFDAGFMLPAFPFVIVPVLAVNWLGLSLVDVI